MMILHKPSATVQDWTEAFRAYARRRAAGELLIPPTMLSKEERRLYVRRTLREDHQYRIHNRPEGAQSKFDKLAASPFVFFRGTALLYYRDYAGMDADLPVVFTVGDIHPENFGVMPNEHGAPFFGVNDFDEACFAPFTYDVKRGAVGFLLVARENGLSKKKREQVVRAWTQGYVDGLQAFAQDDRERWFQYRIDNSPPMIRTLLETAQRERKAFLARFVDLEKECFLSTDKIVPHSKHRALFQEAVNAYRREVDVDQRDNPEGFFTVKDVAVKKESGTASRGLDRYYVLIEGPTTDPADDLILEFKQARPSALRNLVPFFEGQHRDDQAGGAEGADDAGERAVRAHDIHVAGGDPYYGSARLEGRDFVVREHSPFKDKIDVAALDAEGLLTYADLCGKVLAQTHARSDADTGVMSGQGQAELRLLDAIDPPVFIDDVFRFARAAARRVRRDYAAFQQDHALGVFNYFREE